MSTTIIDAAHSLNQALRAASDAELEAAQRYAGNIAANSRYGADLEPWQAVCGAVAAEAKRRVYAPTED